MNDNKMDKEKIRTWFVTGASSGIGRELCTQLLERGFNVVALARRLPAFDSANAFCFSADVTKPEELKNVFQMAKDKFGKIDVLVNSAGISSYGTFEEEPEEEMRKIMEVNFWGTYNTCHLLLPHFRENKNGTIVNISSEMGLYPRAYGVAYCSSKYAVEGLSSSLWWESKSFCRVITVELDKFNGTEIGKDKAKGVSGIEEYQQLDWVPHKSYNFPDNENDLSKAVSYIIDEVQKTKPVRRLMLGKTICIKTNKELAAIKKDLMRSFTRSFACANIDIKKMLKNIFKYKILSVFSSKELKIKYKRIYNTLKYIKENLKY